MKIMAIKKHDYKERKKIFKSIENFFVDFRRCKNIMKTCFSFF